jgi:Domain of unknown function (DUF4424)
MVSRDFANLSPARQAELVKAGLVDAQDKFPQWTVRKTYHWNQTFPAKEILHVAHEYKPLIGFTILNPGELDVHAGERHTDEADSSQICIEPGLQKRIESEAREKYKPQEMNGAVAMLWVDYILTTANSWKTPTKDFELVVERPNVGF